MQSLIPSGKMNWLEGFGFLLVSGIIYTTIKEQASWTSNLITLTFIYTLYLYIKKYFCISPSFHRTLITSIILVFLNVTVSGFGDFNYYKKAIMYISTLMLLIYSSSVHISKKTACFAIAINILIGVLYLTTYQQGFNVFQGEVLLTLNFSNPNQAGMFILNTLLYILLPISALQKPLKILPITVLLVIIIPLLISLNKILILTGCRSALMALIVFLGLTILDFVFGTRLKLRKWVMRFIAVAPFIFVFIYVTYASTITFDTSFGTENAGKTVLTRMKIWGPIIHDFFHYLIFGDYFGISNGTGMSQMHNTHLDIFASYGLVPLLLYMSLITKVLWQSYKKATSRFQRASIYAFIACMVIGTFEASFVAGSGGLFILTNGFILLANCQIIDENTAGKLCLSKR